MNGAPSIATRLRLNVDAKEALVFERTVRSKGSNKPNIVESTRLEASVHRSRIFSRFLNTCKVIEPARASGSHSSHSFISFSVARTRTGTRIGQASECFVYWKDPVTNDTWGLNFTSPADARAFRECCVSLLAARLICSLTRGPIDWRAPGPRRSRNAEVPPIRRRRRRSRRIYLSPPATVFTVASSY